MKAWFEEQESRSENIGFPLTPPEIPGNLNYGFQGNIPAYSRCWHSQRAEANYHLQRGIEPRQF
jgi:hypothetical protein